MLQAITDALSQVLTWFGVVLGSLLGTGTNTALNPKAIKAHRSAFL